MGEKNQKNMGPKSPKNTDETSEFLLLKQLENFVHYLIFMI